ncbi:MAG: polymer-forming cytoskeletal protein [Chitinophagaceae bacterium]|nr:MAG: polymer-forming cytoskeletal protein [Chitinophagaceae bacterium]
MFNAKNKTDMQPEKTAGNGTTLIGAGTILKGDITSNSDLRIDGTITGNIHSSAKVVVGANGLVEGDISGNQADIIGKVNGNIKVKDLVQLRGDSVVNGNLYAAKLQVEPTATFNGQCHMNSTVVTPVAEVKSLNGKEKLVLS